MLQQQVYITSTLLMILDGACIIIAGYAAYYLKRVQADWLWSMDTWPFTLSVFLVTVINNYTMGRLMLYGDRRPNGYANLCISIAKALLPGFAVLVFCIFVFQQKTYSRLFLLYFGILSYILLACARSLFLVYFDKYASRSFNCHRILLVGDHKTSETVIDLLRSQLSWGHELIGRLSVGEESDHVQSLGQIGELATIIKNQTVDEVIFAINGNRGVVLSTYIEICKKMGVFIRILPALWCSESRHFSFDVCQHVPFLTIGVHNFNATGMLYKRLLDILGGLIGTLLFLMMYPFIAAVIKLDSPGPVIFRQQRVGRNGRKFNLYKFRSMYTDADERLKELQTHNEMNGAIFKIKDDPRITRVGNWLRRASLDEFPQFFNVLKGEMSLVGTRPPTCQEVACYKDEHLKRISFKPGLTGLWQVSGRNKIIDFDQIVELDCRYLDRWRFFDDIKILCKTVLVVIQRKGAV